jgi:hypothetical protein
MIMNLLTEVLFNAVIFGVLLYQLYLIFRAYGLPWLKQQAVDIRHHWEMLVAREKDLDAQTVVQEIQLSEHAQQLAVLEQKMRRWHQARHERRESEQTAYHVVRERLLKKRAIQAQCIEQMRLEQQVLPMALEHARTHLGKVYGAEQGARALRALVQRLGVLSPSKQ